MPTALKCIRAIKGISVAQFVSDCKRTSYMDDSDEFLLDFCAKKRKLNHEAPSASSISDNNSMQPVKQQINALDTQFIVKTYQINEFSEWISHYDANSIFYLSGSTTNSVAKHVCTACVEFLTIKNLPDIEFVKKA